MFARLKYEIIAGRILNSSNDKFGRWDLRGMSGKNLFFFFRYRWGVMIDCPKKELRIGFLLYTRVARVNRFFLLLLYFSQFESGASPPLSPLRRAQLGQDGINPVAMRFYTFLQFDIMRYRESKYNIYLRILIGGCVKPYGKPFYATFPLPIFVYHCDGDLSSRRVG